ncbi:MAG: hypothetical protein QOE57_28 [Acidimicrobiaceae bacterium]|nr:hypothetical protein [Acidimicrobiaceae bacterium]
MVRSALCRPRTHRAWNRAPARQPGKRTAPGWAHALDVQSSQGAKRFYELQAVTASEYTGGANEERAPEVRYQWRPSGATASQTPS